MSQRKSQVFTVGGLRVTVYPNGEDVIWIQSTSRPGFREPLSGIFGTFEIKPSEGPFGFGISVENKAGDKPISVLTGFQNVTSDFWELAQLNKVGEENFLAPVPRHEFEERLQRAGIPLAKMGLPFVPGSNVPAERGR